MKKKSPCCKKINDYIGLESSSFSILKSGLVLLNCGEHRIPMRNITRLGETIQGGLLPQNIKLPKISPDKLIKVPLVVPITFCPFCGKRVKSTNKLL